MSNYDADMIVEIPYNSKIKYEFDDKCQKYEWDEF